MSVVIDGPAAMPPIHRKPLPAHPPPPPLPQVTQPQHRQGQQRPIQLTDTQQSHGPPDRSSSIHNRSRTASSNILPYMAPHQPHQPPQLQTMSGPAPPPSFNPHQTTKRTLSNATASTSSTGGGHPVRTNSGNSLQRTGSSRSGNGPPSYVTLMRRQKATVWSDRAQFEDPRLVAQQRLAKQRAFMEMSGAAQGNRVSTSGSSSITGGVRSKIRHHGTPKALLYAPTAAPGSGVPMRLSAREVDEDDSEDDRSVHRRNGSGRSSLGSNGRVTSSFGPAQGIGYGGANTPPNREQTKDSEDTPVPEKHEGQDYFHSPPGKAGGGSSGAGSGDSERENSFGAAKALPRRARGTAEEEAAKMDLARRGSVDERTMTMSGYKLFVANPDLDD